MTDIVKSITPLPDKVLVEMIKKGERKVGSIIVLDDDGKREGIRPRWARIYDVGSEVREKVSKGQWVLIEHGRWSRGVEVTFEGKDEPTTIWNIDPDGILLVSDEEPSDETVGE